MPPNKWRSLMIEEPQARSTDSLIIEGSKKLAGITNVPRLEAEIMLSEILNISQIKLLTEDINVCKKNIGKFQKMIESRFNGVPIAYLTGRKEFWSLEFDVSPSVLVPRPETELLIESVIDIFKEYQSPKVLELGTGSGIISIILTRELNNPKITAVDISKDALMVAKINAKKHAHSDINFLYSDWFEELSNLNFDLIVSNPPYVDKKSLSEEELLFLSHEPDVALFTKDKGNKDLKNIIKKSKSYINESGWIFLEHAFDQAKYCMNEMVACGYQNIQNRKDLQNISRVTLGMIPHE